MTRGRVDGRVEARADECVEARGDARVDEVEARADARADEMDASGAVGPGGAVRRGMHPGFRAAIEAQRRKILAGESGGETTRQSLRCFVAVHVGEAITAHLRTLVEEVRQGADASGWRVTWTRPEGWHVTVKFLGDVDGDSVEEVRDAVGRSVQGILPFGIAAIGLLVLPPGGEPRVLAAGLSDDGSLARLATRLEGELEPLGFARETRRFAPHLTLGRVRRAPRQNNSRQPVPGRAAIRSMAAADWISRLRDRPLGQGRIETVELVHSNLSPDGSVYTTMAAFALRAGQASSINEER